VTWLSWRQFRGQAYVALGLLAVVALTFAVTGPGMAHYYSTTVATCASRGDCDVVTNALTDKHRFLQNLSLVSLLVPALIGIFWGAPLVARELEGGTFRLAWTQSVTRTRWLAVKIAVVGLASVLAVGLLSLLITWWSSPLDRVQLNRLQPDIFSERGIVPIGYAAFAFTIGLTVGVLVRRTLPAMAATFFAFIAVRVGFTLWVRPHLLSPKHRVTALTDGPIGFGRMSSSGPMSLHADGPRLPNAWVTSTEIVNSAGQKLTSDVVASTCPGLAQGLPRPPADGAPVRVPEGGKDLIRECVAKISQQYHVVTTYQPANRFWTFQWMETGIFLALSLLLAGFCFWWVRRRVN
jgi:hypothetical protein